MSEIKLILLGVGNVLLLPYDCSALCSQLGCTDTANTFRSWMYETVLGESHDLDDDEGGVIDDLINHTGTTINRDIVKDMLLTCRGGVATETIKALATCRSYGVDIGLLSNTNPVFAKENRELANIFGIKYLFQSAEMKILKPDPFIYKKVEEITGRSENEILFIDDKDRNLAFPKKKLGWETCCFNSSTKKSLNKIVRTYLDWGTAPAGYGKYISNFNIRDII